MLPLAKLHLNSRALEFVTECIKTGWISSQGHFVTDFEDAMAKYLNKHCVACSSGTAALHLALHALGVRWTDEVLVPSFTFIATANAVKYCGAKPVFCDIDANTWCIDVEDAEKKITPGTAVIIPVHINGYPANMSAILKLASDRGIYVVEDACQALGGNYEGRRLGTIGDVGCFSFFANKQLTTGEGGMCVTGSHALAERIRILRDHGRSREHRSEYVHDEVGFNYRMTNLQAAVGLSQIDTLSTEINRRVKLNDEYTKVLGNAQPKIEGQSPWLCHYRTGNPKKAIKALSKVGIEAKSFYLPVHLQKPYQDEVRLPVCEELKGIMLPLHSEVTDEHIELIKETLD